MRDWRHLRRSAIRRTGATITTSIVGARDFLPGGADLAASITGNVLTISLTDADTVALGARPYVYTVNVTKDGQTREWLAGELTILPPGSTVAPITSTSLNLASDTIELTIERVRPSHGDHARQ